MAGASGQTKRVRYVNANLDVSDGEVFQLLVVTEDDERHVLPVSAAALAALGPLLRPDVVLLFDPEGSTLILANLVGQWLDPDWSADPRRSPDA